jgi:hypothetical protein
MSKRKNVTIGKTDYVAPFQARFDWVIDANLKNVAECRDAETAKGLAKLLNETIGA